MQPKIRICLFVHFSAGNSIPYNVQLYVNELSGHFDKVYFLSNNEMNSSQTHFFNENVIPEFDKNEGYDFGRIYSFLKKLNLNDYEQLALVNDSNILLSPLNKVMEWANISKLDFWGIIDSHEKPWFSKHKNCYHIQSHFIVFNQKAIKELPSYFASVYMDSIFTEKDNKELRRRVINDWEIGLSQFMIAKRMKFGTYKESHHFFQKHGSGKPKNVTHKLYHELIGDNYPLLKKKIATNGTWRDKLRGKNHWKNLIRKHAHKNWCAETIIYELQHIQKQ